MARRSTIGENPLDAVIPQVVTPPPPPAKAAPAADPEPRVVKERLTIHLPTTLIDRVKNAVYWTPGLTMAELAEQALQELLDRMEGDRGESFPQRASELKRGRPIR